MEWSASTNSITLESGQGTGTAVFRQTGLTPGEVRAAISLNGTVIANPVKSVNFHQPVIHGPSFFCEQATYYLDYLPQGAMVQWSDFYVEIISGQGTDVVLVDNGIGMGQYLTISATILYNGSRIGYASTPLVFAGIPELDYYDFDHVDQVAKFNFWGATDYI